MPEKPAPKAVLTGLHVSIKSVLCEQSELAQAWGTFTHLDLCDFKVNISILVIGNS